MDLSQAWSDAVDRILESAPTTDELKELAKNAPQNFADMLDIGYFTAMDNVDKSARVSRPNMPVSPEWEAYRKRIEVKKTRLGL